MVPHEVSDKGTFALEGRWPYNHGMIVVVLSVCLAVLGVGVFALLGPLLHALRGLRTAVDGLPGAFRQGQAAEQETLLTEVIELRELCDRLPQKWEDIKREANSLYKRAHHHVRRTQEELERRGLRDPELDGLDVELRLVDGGGSDEEGVPALHSDLEGPTSAPEPAAVDDWLTLANRRKFGG